MTRPSSLRAVSLFSAQARDILTTTPLRLSGSSLAAPEESDGVSGLSSLEVVEASGGAAECLACHVTFELRAEQVAHYRLDWHRYNLKRRLRGLPHVTQEVFEVEAGDVSSISGSESDSDGSEECNLRKTTPNKHTHHSPFVYFTSGDSETTLYSVYKVTLTGGKEYSSTADLLPSLLSLFHPPLWVVLMHAGGHFAGAVFRGSEVVAHKTFHRYTVRAKRGTAQSVRDSQSGGHGPRSAGARLRRYNETALEREVQELLVSWSDHLREASAIFTRTPRSHQSMFMGGRNVPLSKDDPRVRGIPFVTRRPTLKEVKRVHSCLASIYVGCNIPKPVDTETVPIATVAKVTKTEIDAVTQTTCEPSISEEGEEGDCEGGDSGVDGEGSRPEGEGRRRKARKKKKKKTEKSWKEMSLSAALGQLLAVCERGGSEEEVEGVLQDLGLSPLTTDNDVASPQEQLGQVDVSGHTSGQDDLPSGQDNYLPSGHDNLPNVLNVLYGGVSPLHVASEHGHATLVGLLLQYGADPTIRDSNGRVPYVVAKERAVRDGYRRFMAGQPHMWDYTIAQVPSPLTEDMERERREKAAEKKREKKRHVKKKRAEEKSEREEEVVVRRQAEAAGALSEREKRALAAEKRLALQHISDSSIQRAGVCNLCGRGLAGLVPFHRLQYHYCSVTCVREHKTQLESRTR